MSSSIPKDVGACEYVPDDVKIQMWELRKAMQVKLREETCLKIAPFFYDNAIDFNVAKCDEFQRMLEMVARHGLGFKPPSYHEIRTNLEEATGLAFRFVIGRTNDKSKMSALKREIAEYDDFIQLDIEEEYSKLPYKTLAFFKAAYALFDAEFYVKADDDIYLRPDRLSLLIAKERSHSQTYIGCMKKGPVFTDPKLKWYEPLSNLLGKEYFLHAYGPIYALSADVVQSLVALKNNRQAFLCPQLYCLFT
ncbi:hypothetical protein TSUD_52410 [Trifolium subterraneum]|uniref:Hexosyltransferase n=1 Tax=Trifolium subterraneum TaxID=3900 RepID=A0A2Z6N3C2_TRISU|nr:hypothetical protein TSUD_52410 [Trifolium subterraneum]